MTQDFKYSELEVKVQKNTVIFLELIPNLYLAIVWPSPGTGI